jgi:hypothetical protein
LEILRSPSERDTAMVLDTFVDALQSAFAIDDDTANEDRVDPWSCRGNPLG